MTALLDTCILVDLLRGSAQAGAAVMDLAERPHVCSVSAMELAAGARSQREEKRIVALLEQFRRLDLDEPVFYLAGALLRHYRSSHGLDILDALIAATAEHHGLKLATLNVKHFPMFGRLRAAY